MQNRYYLGIDGGGTKTKVSIIDGQENLLYEGQAGPSSTDTVDEQTTLEHFQQSLKHAPNVVFDGVFCGIGGVLTSSEFKRVESLIRTLHGVNDQTKVKVRNDMEIALASGHLLDEGMVLIAGTGMVAYGQDQLGNTYKSGGWGYKEGDFGSAYDIGYQAIRHAVKSIDGRVKPSSMTQEVCETIGLYSQNDIVKTITAYEQRRTEVADLAKIVTKHGESNDPNALAIIEHATDELALAVRAVYENIQLNIPQVVIVGTLGNVDGTFKRLLHEKIRSYVKGIKILSPVIDPSYAAALLAKRL